MTQPTPIDNSRPPLGWIARVEVAALGLMIFCGLGAWIVGLRTVGYDYDEVTRAHSSWLASQGLRPYNDFFECHPPYFALLVPVARRFADPLDLLLALRIVAGLGNLLFLGALIALGGSLVTDGRRWVWLGVAVVAFHPAILQFLVEFRIDGWGYSIAAWSIYRHRRLASDRVYRDFELGVLTGVATLLFCPKLTILPALIVAFGFLGKSPGKAIRSGLAYAFGVAIAVSLFLLYLTWQGIDLGRISQLLFRYHAVANSTSSFRFGLIRSILEQRTLALVVLAGLLSWAIDRVRVRAWPRSYEAAMFLWLVAQASLVTYPYKQYYAPWFLFAAGYLGFLGQGSANWFVRVRGVFFLAGCLVTAYSSCRAAQDWAHLGEVSAQEKLIRWMNRVASPEDRVVASPPLHPIDRFDTFFLWFNTADPGGFDSGRILSRLPSFRDGVFSTMFLKELEANPPAFVLVSGNRIVPYTAGQVEALSRFLTLRGYRMMNAGPAVFAVRPDRQERARLAD